MREINLGRATSPDQPTVLVVRPILSELWSIFYKNVPREERETYESFFNRMQGLTSEIIRDPAAVELDAFSKSNLMPTAAKAALGVVVEDHKEMARSPYEEDDSDFVKRASKIKTHNRVVNTRAKRTDVPPAYHGVSSFNVHQRGIKDGEEGAAKSAGRRGASSQMGSKVRTDANQLDTKSQMSKGTARLDAQGNLSSQRTVASSTRQTTFSVGAKFQENQSNFRNIDLQLTNELEAFNLQRKQRFESLRQLQSLMERSEMQKPPGTDFLEAI